VAGEEKAREEIATVSVKNRKRISKKKKTIHGTCTLLYNDHGFAPRIKKIEVVPQGEVVICKKGWGICIFYSVEKARKVDVGKNCRQAAKGAALVEQKER